MWFRKALTPAQMKQKQMFRLGEKIVVSQITNWTFPSRRKSRFSAVPYVKILLLFAFISLYLYFRYTAPIVS